MKKKALTLLNVILAIFLVTALLFTSGTMVGGGGNEMASTNGYDPWVDLNDDGKIDYKDLFMLARAYGTSGTPINKTALLLDLLDRVEALESRTGLPAPDYDSGWVAIDIYTTTFTHNLGTTDVLVYVAGYIPITPETGGVHQTYYGDACYWHRLTDTTIDIWRQPDDPYWTQVRVMMWKIREPPT